MALKYSPQTWVDKETRIDAARMQHIEQGISDTVKAVNALPSGGTASLTIGTVTSGSAASASIVNNKLNLVLPKGDTGAKGEKGDTGKDAVVDATLSKKGEAADAKITGDNIKHLTEKFNLLTGSKKEVIDLSLCETGKGRISKNIGDEFSIDSSTAWTWYSFDCQNYSEISANLRCYSTESNYKNIVFVDSISKIVGTENNIGPEGNVLTGYHLFESIEIPFDAVKCYVFSYMNANDVKIYCITNIPILDEIKKYNYDDTFLKIEKSKFDNQFLYISYSQLSGLNSSINTKETYEYCAKNGFNAIKGDVRPTSDGDLIMCHDAGFTLNSNGKIVNYNAESSTPIINMTKAECLVLEHDVTGNHVCDFETYLRVCKKYGKIAYITIRNEHIDDVVVPKLFEYLDKYSMRNFCIVNSFTLTTLKSVRNTDKYIMLSYMSDFSTGTAGIKKSFVEQAVSLGNCRVGIFAFSSSSDDVSLLENSKEAIQYAIQNDIRVDVAITGNKISIDDLMNYGIVGAQRTAVPLLS